jgi:hypothetical protein
VGGHSRHLRIQRVERDPAPLHALEAVHLLARWCAAGLGPEELLSKAKRVDIGRRMGGARDDERTCAAVPLPTKPLIPGSRAKASLGSCLIRLALASSSTWAS